MPLLALVHVDDVLAVDGQVLVRVDHHAEEARVRLRRNRRRVKGAARGQTGETFAVRSRRLT